jgi:type IV secretory pathway TrbF-like protein
VAALFKFKSNISFDDEALPAINARQGQLLLGAGVIILVLILIVGVLAFRPRIPAYVVAINAANGEVLGIAHPVAGSETLPTAVTRYVIDHFIEDARGVTNNIDLERDHLNRVYAFARGQALKAVDDYYRANSTHDPMKQALNGQWTEVSITRCLHQPQPDTYLVEWTETAHTAHGQQVMTANWQALIKVAATMPDPNNPLNPLGEYVINLDWSPAPSN